MTRICGRILALTAIILLLGACSQEGEAGVRDQARTAIGRLGQTLSGLHEAAALTGGSGAPEQVTPVQQTESRRVPRSFLIESQRPGGT